MSSSSSSSSTACALQAIGVLLLVVYAMPFAWALPAAETYCTASAVLLQTIAVAAAPAQHLLQLQLLLSCVLLLACLYLWERCARLAYCTAAAASTCEGTQGCCNGNGCDTADRTLSVSQQQQQHHDSQQQLCRQRLQHHQQPPQQPSQQQQQQPQQRGMAVLAPVTLPARSGAVPVPAALGYSSVFQRSVLAIKVQAPTTGEAAVAFGP
jgi:hypothetical protein